MEILYEDNHCLAVAKPAGILSTHYEGKEETLDRAVKEYLKKKYHKPGKVFLGVVQRLDRPVSGVLLFARTSKAASRLAAQFREGTIAKVYWAIVEGEVGASAGMLEDWLVKNQQARRVEAAPANSQDSRHAVLHFRRLQSADGLTWLELRPGSGRKHQLRVQLSHRGNPIYGDRKYGSTHDLGFAIALHARSLTFLHPIRYEPVTVTAEPPHIWRERFSRVLSGRTT